MGASEERYYAISDLPGSPSSERSHSVQELLG